MIKKEDIIDKILKVKALAERGFEGEKTNAERMLNELMQKYNISDDDIDAEKKELYLFDTENNMFLQLFVQIYHLNYGREREILDGNKIPKKLKKEWAGYGFGDANGNVAIKCTKAEFIELKILFDIYKEDLKIQYDTFLYAYFIKNNLLLQPSKDDEQKETSKEDIKKTLKAMQMSESIEKKEIHKMIENH